MKKHDLKVKPPKPRPVTMAKSDQGYYPSLSLSDKQFPPLKGKRVGDVCTFTVTAQVTGMSERKGQDACTYDLELRKAEPEPDAGDRDEKSEEEGY